MQVAYSTAGYSQSWTGWEQCLGSIDAMDGQREAPFILQDTGHSIQKFFDQSHNSFQKPHKLLEHLNKGCTKKKTLRHSVSHKREHLPLFLWNTHGPLFFFPANLHPALTLQCIYKGSPMGSASSFTAECPQHVPRATKTNYNSCPQCLSSFFLLFKPSPLLRPLFVALRGIGRLTIHQEHNKLLWPLDLSPCCCAGWFQHLRNNIVRTGSACEVDKDPLWAGTGKEPKYLWQAVIISQCVFSVTVHVCVGQYIRL